MAGIRKNKIMTVQATTGSKKLKAAVLLEVLVGLLLVMVAFLGGISLYSQIIRSNNMAQKLRCQLLLEDIAQKSKATHLFIDGEEKVEKILIKKTYTKYEQATNLYRMYLVAMDGERKITEWNELIIDNGITPIKNGVQ